jgi:hypothetical protein
MEIASMVRAMVPAATVLRARLADQTPALVVKVRMDRGSTARGVVLARMARRCRPRRRVIAMASRASLARFVDQTPALVVRPRMDHSSMDRAMVVVRAAPQRFGARRKNGRARGDIVSSNAPMTCGSWRSGRVGCRCFLGSPFARIIHGPSASARSA